MDLHVGKGLRLIKFWPSCAPGKGVCGGARIFGSALRDHIVAAARVQPARSVCVSMSAFSFANVVVHRRHAEALGLHLVN